MSTLRISQVWSCLKFHDGQRNAGFWLSFLYFAVILCSIACRSVDQREVENGTPDSMPDQEAWNTTIYLSRDGRQEATVKAGHRLYFSDSNVTIMDGGIHVQFYDEYGNLASTLEAETGEIDGQTHDLRARGDVTVYSVERGTLETDSLTWVNADNLIETDAAVRLTSDRNIITGEGFEADPAMRRWTIRRQIKGRFLPGAQTN